MYTLELRFAVGDTSRGVLGVTWSPCSPGGSPTGQWGGLAGMLTSSVMWAPPAAGTGAHTQPLLVPCEPLAARHRQTLLWAVVLVCGIPYALALLNPHFAVPLLVLRRHYPELVAV